MNGSRTESFWSDPRGRIGSVLLSIILLFLVIGPFLSGYQYDEMHLDSKNLAPSLRFWFGTDDLGRDIFTRVWYGARISVFIGVVAALIDLGIGLLWGGIAALRGGIVDEIMMRSADILYALPYLLIIILFTIVFGTGLSSIIFAITLTGWITMARIVRGQILLLKEMDFVLASRTMGASFWHILFKHLLPNSRGVIFVTLTLTIPSAIFAEAFLSFLGLGVQAPLASWGTMVNDGLLSLELYPWRLFFPAFFMSLTMLSFHLIGEALKSSYESFQLNNEFL